VQNKVKRVVNGPWKQNCYLIGGKDDDALILDPGSNAPLIEKSIEDAGFKPIAIINTHAHYDHIGAVAALMKRYDIPFYMHGGDADILKRANTYRRIFGCSIEVEVPQITHDLATFPAEIYIGPFRVSWLATPGHTPGGVAFTIGDDFFPGDTLFSDSIGRTDLPGGDRATLAMSLRRVTKLPPHLMLRPGHGPAAVLGEIIASNKTLAEAIAS
jgi:hydroxyacylglutathione hydrolase